MLIVPALPLQAPSPAPSPQIVDEPMVSAGPIAFVIVVLLAVTLVLLIRSMNTQMRRVDFDESGETDAERMRRRDDDERMRQRDDDERMRQRDDERMRQRDDERMRRRDDDEPG